MKKFTYIKNQNQRLDLYLSDNVQDFSRSFIQKLIKDGLVLVNNEIKKANYRLVLGDTIEMVLPKEEDLSIQAIDLKIEVLYEDEYLAIVNKPSGLVVYPGAGKEETSLVAALMGMKMDLSDIFAADFRNGIVHRLDKETSGLMVIAKDNDTHQKLSDLFKKREIERKYYVLASGVFEHDFGTIDAPIGRDENNRTKMSVIASGKDAITYFKVIKRFKDFTFIECQLDSGRTHQIRVHLRYIKHPVVGDEIYGYKNVYNLESQMLQSYYLKFKHPKLNEDVEFTLDLRDDFIKLMDEWS